MRWGLLVLAALPLSMPLVAQTKVKVITKRVERTFPYQKGFEVNIEGEKAQVQIDAWEEDNVLVELELIAKHPDQATAERDLERMRYITERVGRRIYMRNYVADKEEMGNPEAILEAVYRVKVPADCPVYQKIHFGTATISNLTNKVRVKSEFSQVGLENIEGQIDVQTRFGDLVGQKLDGSVAIASRRSDMLLRDIRGSYDIDAQYGVLEIFAGEGLLDLNLNAEKSEVILHNSDLLAFSYDLTVRQGKVEYPDLVNFSLMETADNAKKINFRPNSEFYPNITVSITLGDLYIKDR